MVDTRSAPSAPSAPAAAEGRRRLRVTLLSAAAAILLFGAAAAGVYGYVAITHLR